MGVGHALETFPADENGYFAFDEGFASRARGGALELHVRAPGYVPTAQRLAALPAGVAVRLEPGWSLRGRVVDEVGDPIAGAVIEDAIVKVNPSKWGRAVPDQACHSREDGSFLLEGISRGAVYLLVRHGLSATRWAGPFEVGGDAEVVLARSGEVLLDVRGAGPLAWGRLTWLPGSTEADGTTAGPTESTTLWSSTRDGRWRSAPTTWRGPIPPPASPRVLDPGHRFRLEVPGYLPWISDRDPVPRDGSIRTITAQLEPRTVKTGLRVRVALATRAHSLEEHGPIHLAVQQTLVRLISHSEDQLDVGVVAATTLPPGGEEWFVSELVDGARPWEVRASGRGVVETSEIVAAVEGLEADVVLSLQPAGELEVAADRVGPLGLTFRLDREGEDGARFVTALEIPLEGERRPWPRPGEMLPDGGMRTDAFLLVADAEGTARRTVAGLAPGTYRVLAGELHATAQVRAGETTRVRLAPRGAR